MARYGVLLIGGNRTHQEGYGRSFAEDPRCQVVAVADEREIPDYRAGLNRLLASELGVPYVDDLEAALARDDVDIVSMCADIERRGRQARLSGQTARRKRPGCANHRRRRGEGRRAQPDVQPDQLALGSGCEGGR